MAGNLGSVGDGGMVFLPPGMENIAETYEAAARAESGNDVAKAYLKTLEDLLGDYRPLVTHLHTFKGRITYQATHKMGFISFVRFLINKTQWFNTERTAQEEMRENINNKHDRLIPLQGRLADMISQNQIDQATVQEIEGVKALIERIEANPLTATGEEINSIFRTIHAVTEKLSPEDVEQAVYHELEMENFGERLNRMDQES
jgi:hypothetical protein